MPDIGSLTITLDASQANTAAADLEKLTQAGEKAENSAQGLGQTYSKIGESMTVASTGASALANAYKRSSDQSVQLNESGKAFVASLDAQVAAFQKQIAIFGQAAEASLRYDAALGGISSSVEPTIQKIGQLRAAHEQLAAEQAKNQAARAFLDGLREEIVLANKDEEAIIRYKAEKLGIGDTIEPYITRLNQQKEAQNAAAEAALKETLAQRQLAQAKQANESTIAGLRERIDIFGKSDEDIIRYKAALAGIGNEVEPLVQQLERLKAEQLAASQAAQQEANSQRKAAEAKQSAAASGEAFLNSLRQQVELSKLADKSPTGILRYQAAIAGVSKESESYIRELEKTANAQGRVGISAGQTRVAFQQLGFQVTDIFTSLAGGQNPLLVFIQQGGQIKDSFGGAGAALKAIGSLITPVRVAMLALGAAAGVVALGFAESIGQAKEFAKAIALSGNAAGVTADQLTVMASALAAARGENKSATEALSAFVKTGDVASNSLQEFSQIAIDSQRVLGISIEDTVKKFSELAKEPFQASLKIAEATGKITAQELLLIKALEDQGRKQEAATAAQQAWARASQESIASVLENQNDLVKGWDAVTGAIGRMIDRMKGIGQVTTAQQQIEGLNQAIEAARAGAGNVALGGALAGGELKELERKRDDLLELQRIQGRQSQVDAENTRSNERFAQALRESNSIIEAAKSKTQRFNEELAKYRENLAVRRSKTDVSVAQQAKEEAALREQIFGNEKKTSDNSRKLRSVDLADIKRTYQERIDTVRNGEQVVDALRNAGLIGEKEYFELRKTSIREIANLQVQELNAENARLRLGANNTAQRLENQKQITDNERRIASITAAADSNLKVLEIQKGQRLREIKRAYDELSISASEYIDTLRRQAQQEAEGVGRGNKFREEASQRAAIREKEIRDLRELESFRRQNAIEVRNDDTGETVTILTPELQAQYDERLRIIKEGSAAELAIFEQTLAQKEIDQADWVNGAKEAFANYYDAAQDTAGQFEDVFTDALKNLEDGLVQFIKTGKFDFKSFVDFIQTELLRISVRQSLGSLFGIGGGGGGDSTGLIGSLLSFGAGLFGGGGAPVEATYGAGSFGGYDFGGGAAGAGAFDQFKFGGYRAHGGPVEAGTLYRVNENGPELLNVAGQQYLMMGDQSGKVSANDNWSGGGGVTQVVNFYSSGPIDKRTQQQVGAAAFKGVSSASARNN